MTQLPLQGRVAKARPQPTVYTVLIIVAVIALAVTIGFVLNNLMLPVDKGGYGLELGDILNPLSDGSTAPK